MQWESTDSIWLPRKAVSDSRRIATDGLNAGGSSPTT
ncbi:unannotated protein [freshwater metagenome]|uniref:Unannotated protein n=1 Tax=freshwater metagenome TaxID=449393 RepID=A0A6J5YCK9_9ZZZZ